MYCKIAVYDLLFLFYYHSLNQPLGEVSQTWREEHRIISFEMSMLPFPSLCRDNRCQHLLDQEPERNNRGIPKRYAKHEVPVAIVQCKRCCNPERKQLCHAMPEFQPFRWYRKAAIHLHLSPPSLLCTFYRGVELAKRLNFHLYLCSVSLYQ